MAVASLWCGVARAQTEEPSVAAEVLFRSGRNLMAADKLDEACPKFEESNRLDPKLGTLLNLALCHEKQGMTASAWAEYVRATDLARRVGQSERERVAREHAEALAKKLVHVIIEADTPADVSVTLDGQTIGQAGFGTAIPVDPGTHVVRASAPGKIAYSERFHLTAGVADHTTHVPVLQPEPGALQPPPAPVADSEVHALPAIPPEPQASSGSNGRRAVGLVVGAAGVLALGAGAYFGVAAISEKHTVENECGAVYCTQKGLDAISSMKTFEAASTLTIAGAILAAGAGVYLVVSSPSHVQVGIGPGGAPGLRASWAW